VRIVSASLNYCRGAIFTNANSPYHQKLAKIMRTRLMDRNILQHDIETGLISSRSRWRKVAYTDDFEFPELSFDDLCLLFVSTYKLKQARTYTEEHLDPAGDYVVELETNYHDILRCTIQSRHSNAVKYKCWIKYSLSGEPIIAWYCTCMSGAITIGSCSHVVSIVWYLSYGRYNEFKPSKGRRRIQQAVMERTVESEERDADESDAEVNGYDDDD
jgi:hypothetical protein